MALERDANVLLVEDEPVARQALSDLLEQAGFAVRATCTADEASILLAGTDPLDVLLTDVAMPGQMDGVALAVHARELHPGLPLVFVTGVTGLEARLQGLGQPVACFKKPCDTDALLATMTRFVDAA